MDELIALAVSVYASVEDRRVRRPPLYGECVRDRFAPSQPLLKIRLDTPAVFGGCIRLTSSIGTRGTETGTVSCSSKLTTSGEFMSKAQNTSCAATG